MTYDCQLPYSVKPQDAALHAISRLKLSNSNIPSLSVSRNPSTNQGWGEPLRLLRPWPKKYLDSNVIDSTCFFGGGGATVKLALNSIVFLTVMASPPLFSSPGPFYQ